MTPISDAVVIGIVLGLVFAAVSYYLYSRMTQLERKVGLMENILLDLKVTTEQTLMAVDCGGSSNMNSGPSFEEMNAYHNAMMNNENQESSLDNDDSEELKSSNDSGDVRDVFLEQTSRGRTPSPNIQLERDTNEKPNVTVNYEAMTYKELTALGKQYGISGLRNLSKAQVIDALKRRDGTATTSKQTELSSWTTNTVNFTDAETTELEAVQEKSLDNVAPLDEEDIDTTLVQ